MLSLFLVDSSCSELARANGPAKLEFPGHLDVSLEGWSVGIQKQFGVSCQGHV